jgi:hypothetical protein
MQPTRIFYLALIVLNVALNGFALAAVAGGGDALKEPVVAGALAFNVMVLPVAVFAEYRMVGMTEEVYREQVAEETARAAGSQGAAPTMRVTMAVRRAAAGTRSEPPGRRSRWARRSHM